MKCKIYNKENKLIAKFYELKIAMDFIHREKYSDAEFPENGWFGVWQKGKFIGKVSKSIYASEFLSKEYKLHRIID